MTYLVNLTLSYQVEGDRIISANNVVYVAGGKVSGFYPTRSRISNISVRRYGIPETLRLYLGFYLQYQAICRSILDSKAAEIHRHQRRFFKPPVLQRPLNAQTRGSIVMSFLWIRCRNANISRLLFLAQNISINRSQVFADTTPMLFLAHAFLLF